MAVHHPHLLDFSLPPSTVAAMDEAPPPSFDHGQLLALHVDGTDMLSLGGGLPTTTHRVLADDTAAWPPPQGAVSLSLYNYNDTAGGSSSLFSHGQQHHQFAVTPAAAVSLQAPNNNNHLLPTPSVQPFQLRSSKYLGPVQDLLAEFCSLQGDMNGGVNKRAPKAAGKWEDAEPSSSSSGLWGHPSLISSMDLLELERRKSRLLSMVEEVDRRYRRYREQIRAVEGWFEAVAGAGASQVYTRLALRAMSRHFRCLRDALVAQLRKQQAMGETQQDDYGGGPLPAAGASKGETPRLKVLDQCLRQQRAFQHPVDNYPWRPQRGLPERAVAVLRAWLFEHFLHPYPNDVDKRILARQTGLSRSQVSNWFINARVRLWKPMIEDMYADEVKQQQSEPAATTQNHPSSAGAGVAVKTEQNATAGAMGGESHDHYFRSTATSVVGNPTRTGSIVTSTVGGGDHYLLSSSYPSMHGSHGGAVVSLTLGLQQQPSFAPRPLMPHLHQRSSLMLQGEEEEPVVVPMPYRDRDPMGSQLLHDLDQLVG